MAFNVNLFQGALKLGGARSTLFQVDIANPVNAVADIQVPLLCRAAQVPSSPINKVEAFYFGRPVPFAGNRTFPDWSTTMLSDEDFAIRNALEHWSHSINSLQGNLRALANASPTLYKSDAQVTQFSKTGIPLRVYTFRDIWPLSVEPIDLNWEGEGIQEFAVTWTYTNYEVTGGITGLAGGA
jgi:hypothetical protein